MNRRYLRVRRATDRASAIVLLVVGSPMLLAIALAVRIRMGSPVLFRQVRVGEGGREFAIIKFRTLVPDAETISGGFETPEQDLMPPLGAFLRATSLDELPQLINIARGEMSFIGPRPALPGQVARYDDRQLGRLAVPQGVTGLAQVRYRHAAPWSRRIQSDLEYVERMGPRCDAWILAETVRVTLRRTHVQEYTTEADIDLGPVRHPAEQP